MPELTPLERAAVQIRRAGALLLHTGAGMGVDSGLPDFRGPDGFWKAYPPLRHLGLRFEEIANPMHFDRDPSLAWGFYGHRLQLYRETIPHDGYAIFQDLCAGKRRFAFTSNIDGHHQLSGFDEAQVMEVHGSLMWLQCTTPCSRRVWSAAELQLDVDMTQCRAAEPLPTCPECGAVARPNVLMFGDWSFLDDRTESQGEHFSAFLRTIQPEQLTILEIGAGSAVPTVRMQSERLLRAGAQLIRINPRESHGPESTISVPMGGLEALRALRNML